MKKLGKYTLLGWSWRILMWVALTPIVLFIFAVTLLYIPSVQQWAVDKACAMLSDEAGMDVTVESVRLSFPLDLRMGGMTAVQDGDTVASAAMLNVNVKLLPLFEGKAEVDDASLYSTRLNTKQLIDACEIKGFVERISLDSHSTDLAQQYAVINKVLISDAELYVAMTDSVPEDTTESEPLLWQLQLDDIQLHNVKAKVLLAPQNEGIIATAAIADATAKAFIDLDKGMYKAELNATDIDLGTNTFTAPRISEVQALMSMDTLTLDVKSMKLKTAASELALAYRMDMNAFDDSLPGKFSAMTECSLGKADILQMATISGETADDVQAVINQTLTELPTKVKMRAAGNLKELTVDDVCVVVPGYVTLEGGATVWNATDLLSLQTDLTARLLGNGKVTANAELDMASEAYRANVELSNVNVNKYVKMAEQVLLNGKINAQGRGLDFLSIGSVLKANARLGRSRYGQIDLSNINATATARGSNVDLDFDCNNTQLNTSLSYSGQLTPKRVNGVVDLDLANIDLLAMGFVEDTISCSTTGMLAFDYNMRNQFKVETHVEPITIRLANDSVTTRPFYLQAEAKKDSTAVCFMAGDLELDFASPNNIFDLQPQVEKLTTMAAKQAKDNDFDINALKSYLPELYLHAAAKQGNPVSQILKMYGMHFEELQADINTSPHIGVQANGHVRQFCKDSIVVDKASFSITQTSTVLCYNADVECSQQTALPGFTASLDGYLGMKDADAHLQFFNDQGEKGIDLGLHADGNDSSHVVTLYPREPVIAYQRFALNNNNYVSIARANRLIRADVRLQSLTDETNIVLQADSNSLGEQDANATISSLDVEKLLSSLPIPGLPKMAGKIDGNATYSVENGAFHVFGRARVRKFEYEGMDVGQVGCRFNYEPQGETAHSIKTSLACNEIQVADVNGIYDAAGDGTLSANVDVTDVPMEMVSPFIPDQIVALTGKLAGRVNINGPTDALVFGGVIAPKGMHVLSNQYSVDLTLADDSIRFDNNRVNFNSYCIYGYDDKPLALNGFVDFSDFSKLGISLNLIGNNFKLIESKRAPKKVVFGNMYGDVNARVSGTLHDLSVRGRVKVLKSSNMTYIMSETPLSQGDRLDDIVTFVDFKAPADSTIVEEKKTFMGVNMNVSLVVEDGAKVRAELSADKQSYVDVQGGGTITMTLTPEGVLSMMGRYTINEGEMKYTLPVIPLRTFTISNGSYVEFTGEPMNPTLNITATERTRAAVSEADGSSRSVSFDAGVRLSNTLENMGLEFIIEAPDDQTVQSELESLGAEERNKLAVAMLATNMYLAAGNSKNFTASNALNTFLQSEINNIAGKAFNSLVNVDVGMEQTTRDNGTTRTDYSFKFSRRFFSDRLNVVIGGKVSADGDSESGESNAYIDDISLEWRLDDGGSQYVRIFHEKDYANLIEGDLDQNGAGVLLRKKVEKLSDLLFWRRKEEERR